MEENAAALHTAINLVQALGRGFDVNFDTRLLYCKGVGGSRVVELDNEHTKDLWLFGRLVVQNVSRDIGACEIKSSQEPVGRDSSGFAIFTKWVSVGEIQGEVLGKSNECGATKALDHVIAEARQHRIQFLFFLVNNLRAYGGKTQYVKWAWEEGVVQELRDKELKLSYDSYAQALKILKIFTYFVLICWFGSNPVASISKQLVDPFGRVLSWRAASPLIDTISDVGNGKAA